MTPCELEIGPHPDIRREHTPPVPIMWWCDEHAVGRYHIATAGEALDEAYAHVREVEGRCQQPATSGFVVALAVAGAVAAWRWLR